MSRSSCPGCQASWKAPYPAPLIYYCPKCGRACTYVDRLKRGQRAVRAEVLSASYDTLGASRERLLELLSGRGVLINYSELTGHLGWLVVMGLMRKTASKPVIFFPSDQRAPGVAPMVDQAAERQNCVDELRRQSERMYE